MKSPVEVLILIQDRRPGQWIATWESAGRESVLGDRFAAVIERSLIGSAGIRNAFVTLAGCHAASAHLAVGEGASKRSVERLVQAVEDELEIASSLDSAPSAVRAFDVGLPLQPTRHFRPIAVEVYRRKLQLRNGLLGLCETRCWELPLKREVTRELAAAEAVMSILEKRFPELALQQ